MAIFVPDEVRGKAAEEYFDQNSAYLKSLIKQQPHLAAQALSGEDVERITGEGKCALILSAESGACLGGRLERVEELYEAECASWAWCGMGKMNWEAATAMRNGG